MGIERKSYQRDCLLGALGALLMLVGDLCLSVIPASAGDSGLFQREAYLSGSYPVWRLPLLVATGLLGMALCFFAVRAVYTQVKPQHRITRRLIAISGVLYLTSAGALHLFIGSLADWTSVLSPLLGREETVQIIAAQYGRLMPAFSLPYAGIVALLLVNAYAVASGKTVLPRKMLLCHALVWQIIFVLIPDIRQLLGAVPATMDFVLSQGSGNAAMMLWMLANAVWAGKQPKKETEER